MEDMDSLFEGMVLFTPSQLGGGDQQQQQPQPQPQPQPEAEQDDDDHHHHRSNKNKNNNIEDSNATTQFHQNNINTVSSSMQMQDPLDENLFSDLTLQTLTLQSDTIPTTAFRHIPTRKKKRAASLRIGYGRESASFDDDDPPPAAYETDVATTASAHVHHIESSSSPSNKEDEFEYIKAQISDKLQRSRHLAASLSAARKDAVRRRRKATQDLNSASAKHRDLESQLEAACEAEDFEAAQRISDSLAYADNQRQTLVAALKDAEAQCDAIDSEMHHLLSSLIVAEQECATLLSNFAKEAENNADLVLQKAQSLSSKQLDEWFSSTEALEAKKIELDIESSFINEASLAVNDSIEHSVQDYRIEQQVLHKKKDVLADELQKLLALVRDKEKEIAENDAKIKEIEEKIADAVSGFHDTQSSIHVKYDNLQSQLSQMQLQSEALSTKRKEIDKSLTEGEGFAAKLRELARVSEDEAKAYLAAVELRKSLMLTILKSREDSVRLAKAEGKLTEDVQILQQEVSALRASLQELSSTKSNIQQTIASFKQRIFFIDKRVPELVAEKKVAAAARNFKEAARIAAEAKSLSVEKDSVQINLEGATLELEKLEEDVKNTVSRLLDNEQLISSKEKEVGMARFQRLLLIAGSATAERFTALELGDAEEANVLLAEAEAANTEAKKLQLIYNFDEEKLSNLPKHFISMELLFNLGENQLAEFAASVGASASQ